jgi:hypothetical protein
MRIGAVKGAAYALFPSEEGVEYRVSTRATIPVPRERDTVAPEGTTVHVTIPRFAISRGSHARECAERENRNPSRIISLPFPHAPARDNRLLQTARQRRFG